MTLHGTMGSIVVSGGNSKSSRKGIFAKAWVPALIVAVLFGGVGAYLLNVSHADTTQVVAYTAHNDGCGSNASHKNDLADTPRSSTADTQKTTHVGQTNFGTNSICKCNTGKIIAYGTGAPSIYMDTTANPRCTVVTYTSHNDGCGSNATHYNDLGDTKRSSAADAQKTTHVGQTSYGEYSICKCNTSSGGMFVDFDINNPILDTTQNAKCATSNATVVAYTAHEDGCGGYATHYNDLKDTRRSPDADPQKTVHVGRVNYGNNSLCKCDISAGGGFVDFDPNNMWPDAHRNPGCPAGGSTSSSSTPTSGGSTGKTTTGSSGPQQGANPPSSSTTGPSNTKTKDVNASGKKVTTTTCPTGQALKQDPQGESWCAPNPLAKNTTPSAPTTPTGCTKSTIPGGYIDTDCTPHCASGYTVSIGSTGYPSCSKGVVNNRDSQYKSCGASGGVFHDGIINTWTNVLKARNVCAYNEASDLHYRNCITDGSFPFDPASRFCYVDTKQLLVSAG